MLRYCESLWRKITTATNEAAHACGQSREQRNPFLPPEENLTLASLGDTHKLIFNKYCVVPLHTLIISNRFIPQTQPLDLEDFEASAEAVRIVQGPAVEGHEGFLLFYNSGVHSGATQPHRHLQMIPGERPPMMASFAADRVKILEGRLYKLLYIEDCEPHRLGTKWFDAYASARLILPTPDASYSLVFTKRWMLLVPRRDEFYSGLSFNALAFAGYLLACSPGDLERLLHEVDPMEVIRSLTFPLE